MPAPFNSYNDPCGSSSTPSPAIDAAICDLIVALSEYCDEWFDAQWMNLSEDELEALVVLLLKELPQLVDGRVEERLLLEVREGRSPQPQQRN